MMQTETALPSYITPASSDEPVLTVRLASSARDVEQACRLRYQVFVEEPRVEPLYNASGIERDALDDISDHLIVRDETSDIVVATYRLLPGPRAVPALYTESEFDLGRFRTEIPRTLELARSCVHQDYRNGQAARLLWEGMLRYFLSGPCEYLIGCASLRVDSIDDVNTVHSYFLRQPIGRNEFGIAPKAHLRIPGLRDVGERDEAHARALLPTMVKAYLRIGAIVCPEPIYDPIFRTYDFCMIVPKATLPRGYQRKYGRA